MDNEEKDLVTWDDKLRIGIDVIDIQHKKLLQICNDLHKSCYTSREQVASFFTIAIKQAVEYTQTHFKDEEKLMVYYKYPGYTGHKKEHDDFILEIIARAKEFENGAVITVPARFTRFLNEWILHHIAFVDKKFGSFVLDSIA